MKQVVPDLPVNGLEEGVGFDVLNPVLPVS